jgi:hypothetical protein
MKSAACPVCHAPEPASFITVDDNSTSNRTVLDPEAAAKTLISNRTGGKIICVTETEFDLSGHRLAIDQARGDAIMRIVTILMAVFVLSLFPAAASDQADTTAQVPAGIAVSDLPMTEWIVTAQTSCTDADRCCCKSRKSNLTACMKRSKCATGGGRCQEGQTSC